ncbi:MAG: CoB--CoM heterodisulfide reductase iron-sulfur subunit A family protein [Desulfobulbaceae bacterium]|nr:MAG: CoB--CoM heterodisulfide reductase iron-sulfur subunit A family protein [Desulfobulbaceae bacterium]
MSEVTNIAGDAGDFQVTVKESPRYVDMDKCIACGECAAKCPKKVNSEYDAATGKRKAIYVKYAQAVPLKYQIDAENCIRFKKAGACGFCEKVCPADAVNFDDTEKTHEINVGAVVLAPGFETFDPTQAGVWGFGRYPNVVTAMQFERYLSASGPTEGHLVRPSDGKEITKVAFLQCVGSRDENKCGNGYCSSVCCMYAIKEAVMAKDHVPGLRTSIFMMDMRTHGKDFDRYYQRAQEDSGVRFVRCRVHGVEPEGDTGDLRLHYINEEGRQVEEYFDMVVLSVGLQIPEHVKQLSEIAGIKLTNESFAATSDFTPVSTSKPGIFTCGAFAGPKDIPQSVMEGSAAAAAVADTLAPSRGELTQEKTFPEERNVTDEEAKTGVFVCHCGSNIAGTVDVEAVAEYAESLPGVAHVERNLFSCSQDTQDQMMQTIKEKGLNRVVVAACTPRTHEPLFRETLKAAGLNEYLVEMANIRNQNSWVHTQDPATATTKAKDLVRMAVAKVDRQVSLQPISVPINQKGLVIGGGVTGLTAALNMAEQGFEIHLVEKTDTLGGNALYLGHTWSGESIQDKTKKLIENVQQNEKIIIHMGFEVTEAKGFVGNFTTTIATKDGLTKTIDHGVGVVATGGQALRPKEYGYGRIPNVVTALEFDRLFELKEKQVAASKSVVFIQCVGSREGDRMYCSKVCCTHSVQSAIELKQEDPSRMVYILYRDMRTYGQREALYKKARQLGVIFINYELHGKPNVSVEGKQVNVEVWDHVLHRPITIKADMVVLASAIIGNPDAEKLNKLYKVSLDSDGFFQEAHAKLRPVDCATDGMFVAGLAHYPKPIEESVAQALASSARAATLLSKTQVSLDAVKAEPDLDYCDGCALCLDVCPYNAITLVEKEAEEEGAVASKYITVNKAQCKGCGLCQGTCPKRGVAVQGFTMDQISSQIKAALDV